MRARLGDAALAEDEAGAAIALATTPDERRRALSLALDLARADGRTEDAARLRERLAEVE
jgi:hypothetical protein